LAAKASPFAADWVDDADFCGDDRDHAEVFDHSDALGPVGYPLAPRDRTRVSDPFDLADVYHATDAPARDVPVDLRHHVVRSARPAAVHSPTRATFLDRLVRRVREARQAQLFSTPMRE